jgi:dihydrofolate synthase / folylpolyglutamate synthase
MSDREWLARLELVGVKLGLETMGSLTAELGHPEQACRVIHVAGTNGKGSVVAMVAHALSAAGHRAGRYTSPHLVRLEERFAVDNRSVEPAVLDAALSRVRAAAARIGRSGGPGIEPTYFEITTAVAFEIFREARVEVAVLEVGLGGRFDATNVVTPIVTAITSIDLDHESYLGPSVEAIAGEKAGIIKPGVPVATGALGGGALRVVERAARTAGARLVTASAGGAGSARPVGDGRYDVTIRTARATYGPLTLGLRGRHQAANAEVAALVLDAADKAGLPVEPAAVEAGLRDVAWPARLDLIDLGDRALLVDGAHNPAGALALADYLREVYPDGVPLVFGVMADKDVARMLASLAPMARPLVVTRAAGRRAAGVDAVARTALALASPPEVVVNPDVGRALEVAWRRGGTAVVAGSLYLAGEVLQRVGRLPL